MSSRGYPVTEQRRAERRKAALERQAAYDKLSTQEKLNRLPAGHCKRQRDRLEALLANGAKKEVT